MHFRDRGNMIQIIRTSYDAESKKGKNEIVGRLVKSNPQISEALEAALSVEERLELTAWLAGHATLERLKREFAARTLPDQLKLARQWFVDKKDDEARVLAATIIPMWIQLRVVLKQNGLLEV
jgi:hypothetical protein